MKKQNKNDKKKNDVKLRFIRHFVSELKVEKPKLVIDESWKVDPTKKPDEQGNEDKLVFTLDPDDRKNSSYKLIKRLPEDEKLPDDVNDVAGEEKEIWRKARILGYVKAHRKENKKLKIKKDKKQDKKIDYLLKTKEEFYYPVIDVDNDNRDKFETRVVLHKKPMNYKTLGYLKVKKTNGLNEIESIEIDENGNKVIYEEYVEVIVPTWIILFWLFLGAVILFACLMMTFFPYKAPETPDPGNINENGQMWDGTTEKNGALQEEIEAESIAIPGFYYIELNADRTGIRLMNPNNNVYMRYIIYLKDDPENILYDSDYIDLNSEVVWEAYDQLEGGEYIITMDIVTADPETWAGCNGATQDVKLIIDK